MFSEKLPVRYRSGGQARISVTQVLTLAGQIDSRWFTVLARERGSAVHRLTEDFDAGRDLVFPSGLDCGGYMDAYAAFMAVVRPTYAASELRLVSDVLELGGTIDRVCDDLFGAPGILDFKTGDRMPWHGLQLAAYNALRPTGKRWACYLRADGRYKLREYDDPLDHGKFMYYLADTRGMVTPQGEYWTLAA
jgi:hypothetical protein